MNNNKTNLNLYRFEGGYAVKNIENNKWINLESGHFFLWRRTTITD